MFLPPERNCLYRRSCKLANGRDTTRLRILHGKVYARKVLHRQCKQKRVKQPCHTGGPRYFGELHHAGLVWALRLGTIKANSRQVTINHPSLIFPARRPSPKRPGCCLFPRRVQKMFTSDCGCSQVVPRLLATRCRPGWMADVGFVKVSTKLCNSTLFVIFCPSPRARVSLQAAHASEVGWNPAYFSTLSHELVRLMCQWSFE